MRWEMHDNATHTGKRYSANLSWGKGSRKTEFLIIIWDDTYTSQGFKARIQQDGLVAYDSPTTPDLDPALRWVAAKIKELDHEAPITYEDLIA